MTKCVSYDAKASGNNSEYFRNSTNLLTVYYLSFDSTKVKNYDNKKSKVCND